MQHPSPVTPDVAQNACISVFGFSVLFAKVYSEKRIARVCPPGADSNSITQFTGNVYIYFPKQQNDRKKFLTDMKIMVAGFIVVCYNIENKIYFGKYAHL